MTDAFLADALKYIAQPENDIVLVLRHGGGVRGKKPLDAIKSSGWPVVDCQPLKEDAEKTASVVTEFKAGGRRIEAEAVQAIVNPPLFGEPAHPYSLDRRGDTYLALNLRPRAFCLDPGVGTARATRSDDAEQVPGGRPSSLSHLFRHSRDQVSPRGPASAVSAAEIQPARSRGLEDSWAVSR